MEEMKRTSVPGGTLGLVLLLAVLLVGLAACDPGGGGKITPEIRLSVDKKAVTSGEEVTLTAEVIKGTVTSVTFKADTAAISPITVTDVDANGNFVTPVPVTETTTFTAEGAGPDGSKATSTPTGGVKVEVKIVVNEPKAPSPTEAVKTYRNVPYALGTTPATYYASSSFTVPGVEGAVVAATDKATAKGGKVTILAGTNELVFTYTPKFDFVGSGSSSDSFEYEVTGSNGTLATGTIKVDVLQVPSKITLASSLANVKEVANTPAQTILLTKQIFCAEDPCVRLAEGQTLTGSVTTVDGVTITSPTAGITANIPNTRRSGTGSCNVPRPPGEYDPNPNCAESKVIVLADNTTLENIEITSTSTNDESKGYFTAIFAETDDDLLNTLSGNITIKNVTINHSNGKPIYMKFGQGGNYGNYSLLIEGLDLNDANDTMVIGNPKTFTFRNSNVELLQPVGISGGSGPQPFGDNAGVLVESKIGSNVTIDNVDVFMQSTKYRIDFRLPEGRNASPFEISNRSSSAMALTVKNCDITYGPSGVVDSGSVSFKISGNPGTVNITDSTNNSSSQPASYEGVSGAIQFN